MGSRRAERRAGGRGPGSIDAARWRPAVAAAAVVLVVALLAAGCGADQEGADGASTPGTVERRNVAVNVSDAEPRTGGKLVYGLNAETNGWNPGSNQWAPAGLQVMRTFFDTMTAFDEQGRIHPYLLESFDHNEDFTVWTLNLRPGVVLHNGKPVTAETIVRNQEYLRSSPVTRQAYRYVDSFTATSPTTVEIATTEPWVSLPQVYATQIGVVADPDWLESNDGLRPVGTGPFVFENWNIGDSLTVVRNPDYWQRDPAGRPYPYLDEVEFKVVTDNASREVALQTGDLDILQTASPDTIVAVTEEAEDGQLQLISNSAGEMSEVFIQLNNAVAPFDDVDARRAVALATDKQYIVDDVQQGLFEVANGPYAPSSSWYAASDYPQYDPEAARQLVEEVKARHGGEFAFTIKGTSEVSTARTLQLLQQQWKDVGIDAEIETVEQSKLIIGVVTGDYQAVQWQQFDSADPVNDGVWWEPANAVAPPEFSLNFARYANPEMSEALKALRSDDDLDAQRAAVGQVQQLLARDVPYVWLYHAQFAIVARPDLVNITRYTLPDGAVGLGLHMGAHPLHQVWIDDEG